MSKEDQCIYIATVQLYAQVVQEEVLSKKRSFPGKREKYI